MVVGDERILCISNPYKKLFYFNDFFNLPTEIKSELKLIAISFSERNNCILTMFFDDCDELNFSTQAHDPFFDDIGAELDIRKLIKKRRELIDSINLYFKMVVLKDFS